MSYLEPPPVPAPVIVMKDVGGPVADCQSQTAIYRASEREVTLHECRSACPMFASIQAARSNFILPTIPAIIKPTLRSRDIFDSYPAAVRRGLEP